MKRLKILFLSSWFPYPPDNGSRLRAFYLLQGLAQKHEVTLITFTDPEQSPQDAAPLNALVPRVITFPRRMYQPRRAQALAGFFSAQPRSLADTFDPHVEQSLRETAREGFDLIFAFQLSMAVYARSQPNPAKIFDEVELGLYADLYRNARGIARLRHGLTWYKYTRYIRNLTRAFPQVTVVSALEREMLARAGVPLNRIQVVPNGVDCENEKFADAPREPFTLIYNGALTFDANYDAMRYFVSEILPRLRVLEPRVHIKITGRAPQFAINELSQDNVVSFTGYVADARAAVAGAAVCVVPLRKGGGTRLKILEAMAVGTPVVATSKGAAGLALQDQEHLLIADTPEEFARATLRLLHDPALRSKLARAARERVCQEYDWRVIQKKMERLVEQVALQKGTAKQLD